MPGLSAAATLELWQAALGLGPVERSLALAAVGGSGPAGADELARLPLGRRDARLLGLHATLAGRLLEATATCPACGEQADFAVDADALLAPADEPVRPAPVEMAGYSVSWRSPDSLDVEAAADAGDAAAAERVLLTRCVTSASGPGGEVDASTLPADVRGALAHAMAEADPLAEVLVNVACPACETEFVADLDVGGFVWAEVQANARRVLREVDVLARVYGWSETEVLSLPQPRRAAYLALVQDGVA
jgi:hypothetical protein